MSSNKAFCARPGCGIAYAIHTPTDCVGYIAPDSAAGRAIARADKAAKKAMPCLEVVHTPVPEVIEDPPTAKVELPTTMEGVWNHMVSMVTR